MPPQNTRPHSWTPEQIALLRQWYEDRDGKPLELDMLSARLGRPKTSVCRKARALGLTNHRRTRVEKINGRYPCQVPKFSDKAELRAHISATRKAWIAEHGHPRGALGMRHSEKVREASRARAIALNANRTPDEKRELGRKAAMTKIAKYGTAGPVFKQEENAYSRTRGGRREDLDNRYFRSAWEANYARYLNWLVEQGDIQGWEYETDTFVFDGYTRGAMTYRPDFKVTEKDGSIVYHEVKGWMDGPSKTRLNRMKKHYPEV